MFDTMKKFLEDMRPAFSRKATHRWFVIVFVGFMAHTDTLGVTSIIRALSLAPENYTNLLHFFHSKAWNVEGLMERWWLWIANKKIAYQLGDRIVLIGDHTKTPKNGRKIPAVTTLHQDSETAAKPSFFKGHHWGCVGLLVKACDKFIALPLWANVQEGLSDLEAQEDYQPKTVRIVKMAQQIARKTGENAWLVLDAYFSAGSVFKTAEQQDDNGQPLVHILTRAKKNIVAFMPIKQSNKPKRGRPGKYGKKLHLMTLFDSPMPDYMFQSTEAVIYNKKENIRTLALNLLWKPTGGTLRFILVETSRGRMVLISSDLGLCPISAVELYCRRMTIETLFNTLKNTLGGMSYHFWSQPLARASRRPKRNDKEPRITTNKSLTLNTLRAIEKFVNIQLLVLGLLQVIALKYPTQVRTTATCWLRTVTSKIPSEFVTRTALAKLIRINLRSLGFDWIIHLIRTKQRPALKSGPNKNAA